jgi:hypothetical protein
MSAGSVQDPQFTDNISVASNQPCFLRLQRHSSARFSCRLIHSKRQMQGKCGWSTLEVSFCDPGIPLRISSGAVTDHIIRPRDLMGHGPGRQLPRLSLGITLQAPFLSPPVIPWEPVAVVCNLQPTRPIPFPTDDCFPADSETSVYWLYRIRRLSHSLQLIMRYVQTSQRNPYWILYDAARSVVATDGIRGLLGRGLKTRVVINGAQGLMFSVLWKLFMDV